MCRWSLCFEIDLGNESIVLNTILILFDYALLFLFVHEILLFSIVWCALPAFYNSECITTEQNIHLLLLAKLNLTDPNYTRLCSPSIVLGFCVQLVAILADVATEV